MNTHNKINYIEIPVKDINSAKTFFSDVFGWSFTDYGPEYASFSEGVDGGFYKADLSVSTKSGSPLIVLYSKNLEASLSKVETSGGKILKPVFEFPGGQRFHFSDPNGNEYAVWSE